MPLLVLRRGLKGQYQAMVTLGSIVAQGNSPAKPKGDPGGTS